MNFPISLQINVAPVDMAFLEPILRHQLSYFANLCEEVVLTLETQKAKNSRWSSSDWDSNLVRVEKLYNQLKKLYPNLTLSKIDYSEEVRREVSDFFLTNGQLLPLKDFRGGPYYSYYFGIFSCKSKYVLHMDSDLIFHGDPKLWLDEALEVLQKDNSAFLCSPLVGPPMLEGQPIPTDNRKKYNPTGTYGEQSHSFTYKDISTRIFLIEKEQLNGFAIMTRPHLDQWIKAIWRKIPAYHTPENSLSEALQKNGMYRVDFLGRGSGLWSYHPPRKKSEEFLEMLPHIIREIEKGFFTESQRGHHRFTIPFLEALEESFRQSKS